MLNQFSRTQLLLGKEAMDKLKNSRVAVFGIGGVGGYVCEALVRSGVGHFDLIDDDKVCLTNLNRQIIATRKTVGQYKTDVMKERMLDINPDIEVNVHKCFFLPENAEEFPFAQYDYVVDAVDTVTAKIELVMKAKEMKVPIISSMGAGNKLDPSAFRVADIYKTKMCLRVNYNLSFLIIQESLNSFRIFRISKNRIISVQMINSFISKFFYIIIIIQCKYRIKRFEIAFDWFLHLLMNFLNPSFIIDSIKNHPFQTLLR